MDLAGLGFGFGLGLDFCWGSGAGWERPRELLAVRPRTMPMNSSTRSVVASSRPGQRDLRLGRVGHRPVGEVLAVVQPGQRLGHDQHADARRRPARSRPPWSRDARARAARAAAPRRGCRPAGAARSRRRGPRQATSSDRRPRRGPSAPRRRSSRCTAGWRSGRSRSIGSRTSPRPASAGAQRAAASAAVAATSSSGTSGRRSFQIRTHLAGVTPGTYASRNGGGAVEPVTRPGYRPRSGAVAQRALVTLDAMTSQQDHPDDEARDRGEEAGCVPRGHPRRVPGGCRLARRAQRAAGRPARSGCRTCARNGPHPRPVVAAKLGVSISGLARGGVDRGRSPPRRSRR